MSGGPGDKNYDIFKDYLSAMVLSKYSSGRENGRRAGEKRRARQRRHRQRQPMKDRNPVTDTPVADATDEESLEYAGVNLDYGGVCAGAGDGALEADAGELEEFIEFLASEIFLALPLEVRTLCYSTYRQDSSPSQMIAERYSQPLSVSTREELVQAVPLSVLDTLTAYSLISPPSTDLFTFLTPVLDSYVAATTTVPPAWHMTRASACEICGRDWIPLSYHHLIPKAVHAKALKRGWHEAHMLNKVSWLCRACHSFVHQMASNEELAREWHDIESVLEREDVQRWRDWVGNVRWKKR